MIYQCCIYSFFVLFCCYYQSAVSADSNKLSGNSKAPWNSTATDRLKHELLMHYDKFARPSHHYNTTTVSIGLSIRHVDLNEFKSTFTVNCYIRLKWTDEKLKWNSSDYDGLKTLHVADHEIWQPDIMPYNSAVGGSIDHLGNTNCLVMEDGSVLWVPPAQFVLFCEIDLRLWPFDTQTCNIILGSWTYHGNEIDLKLSSSSTEFIVKNSEWEVLKVTEIRNLKLYDCCSEPYPDVTFNVTIRRRSPTYKAIIITPAFAVIVMTLLNFWLPPQSGEKILLNGTTAIIICLFLLYFSQKCPAMGDRTALIVLFYSSSLYVISFCMIGSVCVLWISRTKHHKALPWMIKHILTGRFGRWLGLSYYINQTSLSNSGDGVTENRGEGMGSGTGEELRDHHSGVSICDDGDEHHILESSNSSRRNNICRQQDWLLFAAAIDRISFIFYSLLFAIFAIAYSV